MTPGKGSEGPDWPQTFAEAWWPSHPASGAAAGTTPTKQNAATNSTNAAAKPRLILQTPTFCTAMADLRTLRSP